MGESTSGLLRQAVDFWIPWRTKEPLIVPDLTGASRLPRPPMVLEQALQGAQRVSRSIIALAAGLALFSSAAHDRWDNGEPVPAWVKTECCGPKDAHHLRPDQVRRNAAGDYVVDIYPDPIPAHIAAGAARRQQAARHTRAGRELFRRHPAAGGRRHRERAAHRCHHGQSMRPGFAPADVEAAGLRILDGIGVRTDDARRRLWHEWLAKHLVDGAACEREPRDCE